METVSDEVLEELPSPLDPTTSGAPGLPLRLSVSRLGMTLASILLLAPPPCVPPEAPVLPRAQTDSPVARLLVENDC